MTNILLFFRTSLLYGCAGLLFLLIAPILALFLLIIPEKKRWTSPLIFGTLQILYTGLVRGAWISLTVNREGELPSAGAVWIANHQSAFDIPLLGYAQQGRPHFWFFWAKFLSTPVLSFFVRRLGVSVSQRDTRHDASSLIQAIKLLKEHSCNALIFPEGGRFIEGKPRAFSEGYIVLARKAGVPIVPVYIQGAGRVYPPYSFFIYPGQVVITIGEPIGVAADLSDEQVNDQVRAWYQKHEG